MKNISLMETTSLNDLFKTIDSWSKMPVSTLNEQQLSLISLKNSVMNRKVNNKNGTGHECFICVTNA